MKNIEVNGLWISDSDELPIIAVMSINSFLKHGHRFTLWTYKNFKNVPRGCTTRDANQILDKKFIYKDVVDSYAHFSDWWRWKFLYENGGFWTDLDVCCLKDDIPTIDGFHICSMTDSPYDAMVGTLMIPRDHDVSKTMLQICKDPYIITEFDQGELLKLKQEVLRRWHSKEDLLKNAAYPSTYRCFGHVLKKFSVDKLLSKEVVYPVEYKDIQHLNLPRYHLKDVIKENTACIHLWSSNYSKSIKIFIQIPCVLKDLYQLYFNI